MTHLKVVRATACIADDRASERTAIQLLVASLARHCPDLHVELFFPPADDAFREWLKRFANVNLRTRPIEGQSDWNVKPYALQKLLNEGYDEVWWLDSDILVRRDFRKAIGTLSDDDIVASEEAVYGMYHDHGYRARAWGLEVGRALPFTLNSCVIRVTWKHRDLLAAWCDALETPLYQQAQSTPAGEKPFHLYGDQDVLTALLAGKRFASIPLKVMRRGRQIIQYFGPSGYTVRERLLNLLRAPALLHCQRDKPWRRAAAPPRSMCAYLNFLRLEASPYTLAARQYADDIDSKLDWTASRSHGGALLRAIGLGHAALTGLPLALLYAAVRGIKALAGTKDRFDPAKAYEALPTAWRVPTPPGTRLNAA